MKTINPIIFYLVVYTFAVSVLAGCCNDPETICQDADFLSGITYDDNVTEILENDEVVFSDLNIVVWPEYQSRSCISASSGYGSSPDCDSDRKEYKTNLILMEVFADTDYNSFYLASDDISELFELTVVEGECLGNPDPLPQTCTRH